MKKSFCDICGERAISIERNHEVSYENRPIMIKLQVVIDIYLMDMPADLCKKCARELLDKIEL